MTLDDLHDTIDAATAKGGAAPAIVFLAHDDAVDLAREISRRFADSNNERLTAVDLLDELNNGTFAVGNVAVKICTWHH